MRDQLPAVQRILDAIRSAMSGRATPVLVALDGPSGGGKSTVALSLANSLDACVVQSDDFFAAEISDAEWNARGGPERARDAIDWRRLRRDALEPLLSGKTAVWQPFDFESGTRPDGTYGMRMELVRRVPAPVIILDGAYSTRPELADLIDVSVLIDAPASIRHRRLAAREAPAFLAAWHDRWDVAEEFYFRHVRPPSSFDLVVETDGEPGA